MELNTPTFQYRKISPDVKDPVRANPSDSGIDIFAYSFKRLYKNNGTNLSEPDPDLAVDSIKLKFAERLLVGTGLQATVGEGFEIQVRPRSGMALNYGLTVLNSPGTVDFAYRGEIGVIIVNLSPSEQTVFLKDKIAQLVVAPVTLSSLVEVSELPSTKRGEGGFGSTGR